MPGTVVSSRRAEVALTKLEIPFTRITEPENLKNNGNSVNIAGELSNFKHCDITNSNFFCLHSAYSSKSGVKDLLRERIAGIVDQSPQSVFLSPSGMAAIYSAIRVSRRINFERKGKIVVFGFPYLDTLKMAARRELSEGVEFFGHGNKDDIIQLETLLSQQARNNDGDAGVCALGK